MTVTSLRSKASRASKTFLVNRGPKNAITRMALQVYGRRAGFRIRFGDAISLQQGASVIRVANSAFHLIPYMLEYFQLYFDSFFPEQAGEVSILDFSKPAFHRYRKTGIGFYFPSIPEEEFGQEYTRHYCPGPGEVVFDLGANAGATAYFFSKMVGEHGRVFAFEPDDRNYEYLLKNIAALNLRNVVPIKKAIGGSTGLSNFHMDGSLASGLAELVSYTVAGAVAPVEVLTLADACDLVRAVPNFIKMDVEGAEIDIVSQSQTFLRKHQIHFAVDSCHIVKGRMTRGPLEALFSEIGYAVRSSAESGQMFTWAAPGVAH